jgi:trypsin
MHAKSVLVALAVPALISAAAIPQEIPDNWDENSSDIVGGVAAAQGDLPFIVSVQVSGSHLCGGTLVNANTVISAAHCYYGRSTSGLGVRAGSLVSSRLYNPNRHETNIASQNRGSGGVTATISSVRLHPNYNDDTSDYDMAVLKLSSPISTSSTISYATLAAAGSDPAAGSTVTTAGWYVHHLLCFFYTMLTFI